MKKNGLKFSGSSLDKNQFMTCPFTQNNHCLMPEGSFILWHIVQLFVSHSNSNECPVGQASTFNDSSFNFCPVQEDGSTFCKLKTNKSVRYKREVLKINNNARFHHMSMI